MLELFVAMLKEEWRIHSTMFGASGFALFPFLLTFLAFSAALLWPLFSDVLSIHTIVVLIHYSFVLVGASVGAFGLFGREVMNRRFGQASMIAYSSRSLPVSEQRILLNFIAKDTVYYFFFWVLPFIAGIAIASPWIGISLGSLPLLLLTVSLSFLIGLSLVFLLSTVYVHSSRLLLVVLLAMVGCSIVLSRSLNCSVTDLLPSLTLFSTSSLLSLLISFVLILGPCAISVHFMKLEYRESDRRFPNALILLIPRLSWSTYAHFIAKDTLDLTRSEGGAGKIVFSFIFPVMFIWIALFVLLRFIPFLDILIVFAIFLGIISSTIYNWVTEFDLFTSYAFLPIEVSTVLMAKLQSYTLLNLISIAILFAAALSTGELVLLPLASITFASVSFYAVAVTIYLAGLSPSVMLYNARIYIPYLGMITPVILFLLFVSISSPLFVLSGILCLPIGWLILKRGIKKWNCWSQPNF